MDVCDILLVLIFWGSTFVVNVGVTIKAQENMGIARRTWGKILSLVTDTLSLLHCIFPVLDLCPCF